MTQNQRIAIIDDSPEDREAYRRYLLADERYLYEILEAEDGEEGLALCDREKPDLILLDFVLPGMDGLEFINELKILGQTQIPVIMLTGQGSEEIAVQALKNGVSDYLVKGKTTPESLRLTVRNIIEQSRLLSQLEESEQRFQETFKQAVTGIAHIGLDGQCLLVNQSLCDILGYTREELLESTFWKITNSDRLSESLDYIRLLADEITSYSQHKRFIRQDGVSVWLDWTISLVRATSREPKYLIAIVQDISDVYDELRLRKQAEEALQQSESHYATLAKVSPVGIFHTDPEGNCLYVNERWCAIAGLTQQAALGEGWIEALYPGDRSRVIAEWYQAAQQNLLFRSEYRFQRPDGAITWVYGQAVAKLDSLGQVLGYVGTITDISDRKQLEESLSRSQEQLSLAQRISNIGTFEWNIQTNEVVWTPELEALYGLPPGGFGGKYSDWAQTVHPDDRERTEQALSKMINDGKEFNLDFRICLPDGNIRWLEGRGNLVYDQPGDPKRIIEVNIAESPDVRKPCGMIGVNIEIGDRKQAEAALHQQIERQRLVMQIAQQIQQSIDLDQILNVTVTQVRQFLQAERVFIYRFQPDWSGVIMVESVVDGWMSILNAEIKDPCFMEIRGEDYKQGRIKATADIYTENLSQCYVDFLKQFAVRANLVVPILQGEALWGLLIANQCSKPRQWQPLEIDLLHQLATQVGIAIQQSSLLQQAQRELNDRQQAQQALRQVHDELENRVKERTIQLSQVNSHLRQEVKERQQANIALRESEARFRTMADTAPVLIWMAGTDKNCNYFNRSWLEFTGKTLEQEIDNGWVKGVHPEDRERCMNIYLTAFDARESFTMEYRLKRFDDEYRWILDSGMPRFNEDGSFAGYIGSCIDISDVYNELRLRKQAEENLHLMSAALESAVEGISRLDAQGRYLAVNSAYVNLVGYEPEEMIGMEWQRTVHPEDQANMLAAYQYMLDNGKVEVESRGIRKDGSVFYKQLVMVTTYDKQQQFLGHYCFAKDISDRKLAEQQIREQAALLNVATDAIFVRNLQHQILFWNKSAESLYGWTAAEVMNQNAIQLLFPEENISQLEPVFKTVIERGSWQGELQTISKSGKKAIVASRWTLVRDEAGKPQAILTVDTDITEKKELEARFLRAQRLESLGTLASGIAHDLNNVLTPILASAQLLPLKLPNTTAQNLQLLQIIENSAKRGAELVKQILAFARGTPGKRSPMQIRLLLSEIEQVAKNTFPKSIEICTNFPQSLGLVFADATQLHQILMNLCINACDAMPNGGTLTLTAENRDIDETYAQMYPDARVGAYVIITVADTGCGIPKELLDRIFDPFFTTKEPGKGTGLGLATTLGIIKTHEGFITVSSEVGKGTQFQVYLPMNERRKMPRTEDLALLTGKGELILVVDDEAAIRQIAETSLQDYNYKTITASDGVEAIALYAQHKHDISVVLMDLLMPSLDGLTAIRALKRLNPQVKIIAMSGFASNTQLAEAADLDIETFLLKPYTLRELLTSLHSAINLKDEG
jgi:PAS domain S-box-containing protein